MCYLQVYCQTALGLPIECVSIHAGGKSVFLQIHVEELRCDDKVRRQCIVPALEPIELLYIQGTEL